MCFEQLSLRLEHDACRACWAEAGCGAEVWTGAGFSFKRDSRFEPSFRPVVWGSWREVRRGEVWHNNCNKDNKPRLAS